MATALTDNTAESRFELNVDGQIAYANYERRGQSLVIPFVYSAPPLRGTGAAERVMEGVTEIARQEGRKIVPLCGYARAWLRRHPEHNELVA